MVLSMDRWVGRIAIVTGASSGIGASISEALVENGLIVVGAARRVERIEKNAKNLTGKKGKLYAIKADVSKEEDILRIFDWTSKNLGPVHILINNAGTAISTTLTEGETQAWKTVFDLNVLSLCIATREAVKIMKQNKINGHIVHMNSVFGHEVYNIQNLNVYPASKYAVTALTETLRQELNGLGLKIKITSISPGLVETELTTLGDKVPEKRREFFSNKPILKSEDIADGIIYALSTPDHVQIHEITIRPFADYLNI